MALLAAACQIASPEQPRPLRLLVAADLPSLDPQTTWDEVSSAVLGNVFDTLVRFDSALHARPGVARSWITPDPGTWRFRIDPQARFHDGTPVRAEDVVFSIERQRSIAGAGGEVFARHVGGVRALGDDTVDVVTDAPAVLLSSLAAIPILSRRHSETVRPGGLPMGSGPYRMVAWEAGRRAQLVASPYWSRPLAVREVEILLRPPDVSADEVIAARPDLALFLRLSTLRALDRRRPPGLRTARTSGLSVFYVALNTRAQRGDARPNPLHDPRLRQALDLALDRRELARVGLRGYGRPAWQLVPPEVVGYDPGLPPAERDLPRARALLREAGHPALELGLLAPASDPAWLGELLRRQWAQAGITLRIRRQPDESAARLLDQGAFDLAIQGYGCTSGDAGELLSFALRSPGAGGGAGNIAGYANPEVDRLADLGLRQLDPRDRLQTVQRALRQAAADRPYLPLYSMDDVVVVAATLRWRPRFTGEVRVADMATGAD